MNRKYRKELPKLNKMPDEIYEIYIIPDKEYRGFWGQNGYKSFDFIVGNKDKKIGWLHWEGDAIHLINDMPFSLNIDCAVENEYLRLFSPMGLTISDMRISDITIKTKGGYNED